jgi:Tfp pilus assembly protein PilF
MMRRLRQVLYLALLLLAATAAVVWYGYERPRQARERRLELAEQALTAEDLADAAELVTPLIKETPGDVRVHRLHAQVLRRLGHSDEAHRALDQAVRLGLPEAARRREAALLAASEDFANAHGLLRQALRDSPTDREVLHALARGYARQHRWTEAEEFYARLLEVDADQDAVQLERGRARLEARRIEAAAEDFAAIVARSPRNFQARLLLAHCLLSNAQMAEAEAQLTVCQELRSECVEPLVGLASCAVERGDLNQAQARLQRAFSLNPKSGLVLNEQGNLYLLRQRYDLAAEMFREVIKLDPHDKRAHLKLAQALRKSGQPELALEHARRYEALDREEDTSQPASPQVR